MSVERVLMWSKKNINEKFCQKNHDVKKNVWTSDKSWEPGSFFNVFLRFSHSHFLSLSHSLTLSLSHSFSLSHSLNLSFNHSRHAEQLLFSCLCSKFAVYRWKWWLFLTKLFIYVFLDHISTRSCDWTVHRAGSQLKMSSALYRQLHSLQIITKLLPASW